MIYYIDNVNGKDENDGLSPEFPKNDASKTAPAPGDTVLFKRGTVIKTQLKTVSGTPDAPVTYGAYGEGEAPVFTASVDLSDPSVWKEEAENIWVTDAVRNDEVCNFIFNDSSLCGALRWVKEDLCAQGDFYDNCFGYSNSGKKIGDDHRVWLYSEKNPALYYASVCAAVYGERVVINLSSNVTIRDITVKNSGLHAAAGCVIRNFRLLNCSFLRIGGCVWNYERRIRFGNGMECWDIAENVEVSGCIFSDIYDSAVTHQGSLDGCRPCENLIFRNNVFIKCGMGAYEQRDRFPKYAEFIGNVCIDAGKGFSALGEVMPRSSEIWPQPMGHHIFMWRIDRPTEGGRLIVKDNIFHNAPYCAAIYSIISAEAEKQMEISSNTYYTENPGLLSHLDGVDYKDFSAYEAHEPGAQYQKTDIEKYLI